MRDRLIELISKAREECTSTSCFQCEYQDKEMPKDCVPSLIADCLITNGVILPPCKVGDTVYVCNRTAGKIFKNTVVGIFLSGASPHRNGIKCEYRNICGETSNRKFTFAQIGKTIFLTREEAENALKEKE